MNSSSILDRPDETIFTGSDRLDSVLADWRDNIAQEAARLAATSSGDAALSSTSTEAAAS